MTWCCDADDDGSGVDVDDDCVFGVLCRYDDNSSGVNDDDNDSCGLDANDACALVLTGGNWQK